MHGTINMSAGMHANLYLVIIIKVYRHLSRLPQMGSVISGINRHALFNYLSQINNSLHSQSNVAGGPEFQIP